MSASKDLVGRGSIYTIATAVRLGHGILILPILTRLFSVEQYGEVALALVIGQVIAILASFGLPGAATRLHYDPDVPAAGLAWATVPAAVLVTAVVDVTSPLWIEGLGSLGYTSAIRAAVWSAVPLALLETSSGLLRVQNRPGSFVLVSLVGSVGARIAGLGAVLIWGRSPAAYVVAGAATTSVAALLALRLSAGTRPILVGRAVLVRALRLGLPLAPHALALFAMTTGDRVIVERLLGVDELGRYQVAYVVGALGIMVLVAFGQAWAPIVFGASDTERWSVLSETTNLVVLVSGLTAAGLALAAPVGLRFLAPSSYDPTALGATSAIVAASVLPYSIYLSRGFVLSQVEATGSLAIITPAAAAANLGLNFVMIPRFGLEGAAVATLSAYMLQAAAVWVTSSRLLAPTQIPAPHLKNFGPGVLGVCASLILPAEWTEVRMAGAMLAAGAIVLVGQRVLTDQTTWGSKHEG